MAYDYYDRPRRTSPALLFLGIALGVLGGFAILLYINKGFQFQNPPNDPNAQPRLAEPQAGFDGEETEAITLFKECRESVVNVDTVQRVRSMTMGIQEQQTGTGSGFVWDTDGRIVTNFHVVRNAITPQGKIRIVFPDRSTYDARIVGVAPDYDLAVVQVSAPASKLKPIRVGSSKNLEVGQKVFAIGNPFGLSLTMTKGIISALDREINSPGDKPITGAIQIDAPINPGNSGGPLLDREGKLIGVNTAIASPSGGNVGIGFAIPVDTVNEIATVLIRDGKLVRPDAGIKLVNQNVLWQNGIRNGAMVAEVDVEGPAAGKLSGLTLTPNGRYDAGDLITAVDGVPVANNVDFLRAIAKHKPGDTVKLTVERNNQSRDVDLTLRGV